MDEVQEIVGASSALERTCNLQSKLRQAVQDLHPLTTSLDADPVATEKERHALLVVTEHLELLEDRLREYRCIDPYDLDLKAITLRHMEATRRELLEAASNNLSNVLFAKEVLKEVIGFADVNGNLPSGTKEGYNIRAASKAHEKPHTPVELEEIESEDRRKHPPGPSAGRAAGGQHGAPRAANGRGFNEPFSRTRVDRYGSYDDLEGVQYQSHYDEGGDGMQVKHTLHSLEVGSKGGFGSSVDADSNPSRSEIEEADRIIAKYSIRPDFGGTSSWVGPVLPARDEDDGGTINGNSRYQLDPDFGGKLKVGSSSRAAYGIATQDAYYTDRPRSSSRTDDVTYSDYPSTSAPTAERGGGNVIRPSMFSHSPGSRLAPYGEVARQLVPVEYDRKPGPLRRMLSRLVGLLRWTMKGAVLVGVTTGVYLLLSTQKDLPQKLLTRHREWRSRRPRPPPTPLPLPTPPPPLAPTPTHRTKIPLPPDSTRHGGPQAPSASFLPPWLPLGRRKEPKRSRRRPISEHLDPPYSVHYPPPDINLGRG